jgi:hypothetical protein
MLFIDWTLRKYNLDVIQVGTKCHEWILSI